MSQDFNKTDRYEEALSSLKNYKEEREARTQQLAALKAGKNVLRDALFSQIRSVISTRNQNRSAWQAASLMDDINEIIRTSLTEGPQNQDENQEQIEDISPLAQLSQFRSKLSSLPEEERVSLEASLAKEFYDDLQKKYPNKYPNLQFANNLSELQNSEITPQDLRPLKNGLNPNFHSGGTLDYSSMLDMNFKKPTEGTDDYFGLDKIPETNEKNTDTSRKATMVRSFFFKVHKYIITNLEGKIQQKNKKYFFELLQQNAKYMKNTAQLNQVLQKNFGLAEKTFAMRQIYMTTKMDEERERVRKDEIRKYYQEYLKKLIFQKLRQNVEFERDWIEHAKVTLRKSYLFNLLKRCSQRSVFLRKIDQYYKSSLFTSFKKVVFAQMLLKEEKLKKQRRLANIRSLESTFRKLKKNADIELERKRQLAVAETLRAKYLLFKTFESWKGLAKVSWHSLKVQAALKIPKNRFDFEVAEENKKLFEGTGSKDAHSRIKATNNGSEFILNSSGMIPIRVSKKSAIRISKIPPNDQQVLDWRKKHEKEYYRFLKIEQLNFLKKMVSQCPIRRGSQIL